MPNEIIIRKEGRIGHITLARPDILNALSYDMCLAIETALDEWVNDDDVSIVLIDAEGERAFCAGGDVQDLYNRSKAGDLEFGRKFWRDEYRLNAKIVNYPKPYVALMQGFTMGGGVGVSCHGSHRVVCENSQIAMPECGIGLVPDIGGSLILARSPGRCGEYLGVTGQRMGPGDAIYAGFADYFIPQSKWPELTKLLIETGDYSHVDAMAIPAPKGDLVDFQAEIDKHFGADTMGDIFRSLSQDSGAFAQSTLKALSRPSPLAMVCCVETIHRVRGLDTIEHALGHEYRFTYRAVEGSDFIEGVRAAIIDKDRSPKWKHATIQDVPGSESTAMLMPLGDNSLQL